MDKLSHHNRWDTIAWNGISFNKPATWEIATIGRNYMMIGTLMHPRLEITWGDSQKTASRKQNIEKLQLQIRKQHLMSVDSWSPPKSWIQALSACETSGFSSKRPEGGISYGLIVSCLSCQRVSLVQFFQNADEPENVHAVAPEVLSSFMDHADGEEQLWAVFDVRATLPAVFKIKKYRFSPGYIEMVFFAHGHLVSLYRWSPASVLLSGKKLIEFAGSSPLCPGRPSIITLDLNRIEWKYTPSFGLLNRFVTFISGRFSHRRTLIRHDPVSNRILAVKAESRLAMDSSRFDRISSSYEIAAT
jgi:hypothetical protein